MLIVGCDFHKRFQQIAMVDTTTGEIEYMVGGSQILRFQPTMRAAPLLMKLAAAAQASGLAG